MATSIIDITGQLSCLAAVIFSLSLATDSFAQGGGPAGAGPPPIVSIKRGEHSRRASEAKLRSAEMEADANAENRKHIQAAIKNMKQDFSRIQVLRNDIARNLVAHRPLDYDLITKQTSEINKRAHRLNVYMMAHSPEDKEPHTSESRNEEMVDALVKLCKLIDSFTENPALKNAATVDVKEIDQAKKEKARADADLLAIIRLSDGIHRNAESLKTHK